MQVGIEIIEDMFLQGEAGACVLTSAIQGILIQEVSQRYVLVAKSVTGTDYPLSCPRSAFELDHLKKEMAVATKLIALSQYRQKMGTASNPFNFPSPSPLQEAND